MVAILGLALAACDQSPADVPSSGRRTSPTGTGPAPEELAFLDRHWPDRIPPQGPPPAGYSPLEASLDPEDCGLCHPRQWSDWRTSLHSRAMGPGVLGQLLELDREDPETARACRSCHAPLAEQSGPSPTRKSLAEKGVICAGCHVRKHRRYGPPPIRGGSSGRPPTAAHGGFTASTAFLRSAFCSRCHQFGADSLALAGKPLENTYEEWRASRYAREGIECQDCHMPGRRHLWRGIHDPETTRRAIGWEVTRDDGDPEHYAITIENRGSGHHLPTYTTPRIVVRAELVDERGRSIAGTLRESVIGREISLDLSREIFDTRIPADGTLTLDYAPPPAGRARGLRLRIVVEPDAFYRRFHAARLAGGGGVESMALLRKALEATRRSVYTVVDETLRLEAIPPSRTGPAAGDAPTRRASPKIDWNDAAIDWHDYDEGLRIAGERGRPVLLILYAEWCPTCHAYSRLFRDPGVVSASRAIVMVRVDVDRQPAIARRYTEDGDYVPRTYVLDTNGHRLAEPAVGDGRLRHFLPAEDPSRITRLIAAAAAG